VRVAVCCPGPSLPRRWFGRIGYDCVYAVNRAMITVPEADWLSAGDIGFFVDLLPAGARPGTGVVTFDDTLDRARSTPTWSHLVFVGWNALPIIARHADRGRPLMWSVQAALCHAAESDATEIDLYGCDGAAGGTRIDCTGYPGESRGPDRWAREELDLAVTAALLAERGVSLTRIPH
jgi:hypothetical protein